MDKDKLNWEALADELRGMLENTWEGVAVEVIVGEDKKSVEVYPASHTIGSAFHHTEEIVDFCRVKRLSNYASFCERYGRTVCYMRIF